MPRYLIIRFSSIGDIVLTSPVVRCLKQQVPGAEVHFLTKKQFAPVVEHNPYIDQVHYLDENEQETISLLKKEQYDEIIDLHHNLRTLRFSKALGVKTTRFRKLNIEKWLLVNLNVNRLPRVHIVDRYMDTVSHLGVKNDGAGLNYFITDADRVDIQPLPSEFHHGYIAIVAGATYETKRMPSSLIVDMIREIQYPVVLMGGPGDVKTAEDILSQCRNYTVYNACGIYSLNQSASLVNQASLVISSDTGLMHIAAAYQKKIISVWGNTVPEFGMYPYEPVSGAGNSVIIENNNLNCRPCSKLGYHTCPKKHFKCMNDLNASEIVAKAIEMLK